MINKRVIKRGDDMDFVGKVTRKKKGRYLIEIWFAQSRRLYHAETIDASNVEHAKRFYKLEHPTLTFKGKRRKQTNAERNAKRRAKPRPIKVRKRSKRTVRKEV